MPTNEEDKIRLPRHVHRKRIKLMKRQQRRQQPHAQQKTVDEKVYLAQKAQWEEKERQYDLINLARQKVIETEKKAREDVMNQWHASLQSLPIPKPPGYSSTRDGSTRLDTRIHKVFVPSSTKLPRTYRDKFELTKKRMGS
ncbi:hypothetical protein BC941DRAFT_475282 [Chlamydoabsidia padenii]|nr:hypothetical protein BC941DRAFT_475282 [Chlamydoabsidia padenii]